MKPGQAHQFVAVGMAGIALLEKRHLRIAQMPVVQFRHPGTQPIAPRSPPQDANPGNPPPPPLQPTCRGSGLVPGRFPRPEPYARRCLSIPLYPTLDEAGQERVAQALRTALRP